MRGDKFIFNSSKISNFDYNGHNIGGHFENKKTSNYTAVEVET